MSQMQHKVMLIAGETKAFVRIGGAGETILKMKLVIQQRIILIIYFRITKNSEYSIKNVVNMIAFRKLIKKAALIIAVNTLLVSCCLLPVERTWTDEYVIDNNTNHSITICYVFEKNYSEPEIIRDTIKIEPNTEYLESKLDGFHGEAAGIFPIDTDSVVITFDNEREIIQTCEHFFSEDCTIERNIVAYWDEANYAKIVIAKKCKIKAHRYTYTFTEKDYDNAVPIEK